MVLGIATSFVVVGLALPGNPPAPTESHAAPLQLLNEPAAAAQPVSAGNGSSGLLQHIRRRLARTCQQAGDEDTRAEAARDSPRGIPEGVGHGGRRRNTRRARAGAKRGGGSCARLPVRRR